MEVDLEGGVEFGEVGAVVTAAGLAPGEGAAQRCFRDEKAGAQVDELREVGPSLALGRTSTSATSARISASLVMPSCNPALSRTTPQHSHIRSRSARWRGRASSGPEPIISSSSAMALCTLRRG